MWRTAEYNAERLVRTGALAVGALLLIVATFVIKDSSTRAVMQPPRSCADFRTQAEAQAYWVMNPSGLLDRDGDYKACERLQ